MGFCDRNYNITKLIKAKRLSRNANGLLSNVQFQAKPLLASCLLSPFSSVFVQLTKCDLFH